MATMKDNMNEIIETLESIQYLYNEQGMTLYDVDEFMGQNPDIFYPWSFDGEPERIFHPHRLVDDIQACAGDFGYEVVVNVDKFGVYYELIKL